MYNARYQSYSQLYEAKIRECDFLLEQNITASDIIDPLEDLITEEFIQGLFQKGKDFVKGAYQSVKDAIKKVFNGVVNFFKNFSLKKLAQGILNKVTELGTKFFAKLKKMLSGFRQFIIKNNMVDENNKPILKNIWSVLCAKAKTVAGFEKAGLDDQQLQNMGSQIKMNESKYDISDEEVKYYGFFEKLAHALGIKNARFNGVVSQITQKGTFGLAIAGILKFTGFTFGTIGTALAGLSPAALIVIGAILLMAGLIILAIWVCKPYPTLDDCLGYLKLAFSGQAEKNNVVNYFTIININQTNINISGGGGGGSAQEKGGAQGQKGGQSRGEESKKSGLSSYGLMIRNLKALMEMLRTYKGVKFEGESGGGGGSNSGDRNKLKVGNVYTYTNKKGEKKKVKLISLTHDTNFGKDREYLTGDDKNLEKLAKASASVISKDKEGKFSYLSPRFAVDQSQLSESRLFVSFTDFVIESERFGDSENVTIHKNETHLTQAFQNTLKSIKVIMDEKDKGVGITYDFVKAILDKKMDEGAKEIIKKLYDDVYFYVEGPGSKTISDLGPLYKESIEVISNKSKRQTTAEKIARLAKRTMLFEGEGLYGGLGQFGTEMKTFNTSLKEIMGIMRDQKK